MVDYFHKCCEFSLVQEGGFSNVRGDPGGATNHGITMAVLSAVLGHQASVTDVEMLTQAQAEAIYKPHYWYTIDGYELPLGINALVFDFGINTGPQRSAMRLQTVLGVRPDGFIGPNTIKALNKLTDVKQFIVSLSDNHKAYYKELSAYLQFEIGWLARAERCFQFACIMQ